MLAMSSGLAMTTSEFVRRSDVKRTSGLWLSSALNVLESSSALEYWRGMTWKFSARFGASESGRVAGVEQEASRRKRMERLRMASFNAPLPHLLP